MKTWHKIVIALVVPTVIVVGIVAYKKFYKKEDIFSKKKLGDDSVTNNTDSKTGKTDEIISDINKKSREAILKSKEKMKEKQE